MGNLYTWRSEIEGKQQRVCGDAVFSCEMTKIVQMTSCVVA